MSLISIFIQTCFRGNDLTYPFPEPTKYSGALIQARRCALIKPNKDTTGCQFFVFCADSVILLLLADLNTVPISCFNILFRLMYTILQGNYASFAIIATALLLIQIISFYIMYYNIETEKEKEKSGLTNNLKMISKKYPDKVKTYTIFTELLKFDTAHFSLTSLFTKGVVMIKEFFNFFLSKIQLLAEFIYHLLNVTEEEQNNLQIYLFKFFFYILQFALYVGLVKLQIILPLELKVLPKIIMVLYFIYMQYSYVQISNEFNYGDQSGGAYSYDLFFIYLGLFVPIISLPIIKSVIWLKVILITCLSLIVLIKMLFLFSDNPSFSFLDKLRELWPRRIMP